MEMAVRLTPAWGMLEVTGIPGSRVIATRKNSDPVDLGLIPEEGKLRARKMLYSGEYNVEVSHPRYRSVAIEDVRLPRGRQVSREVEMEPKPGKVQVLTVPEGALVTMDDKRVGTTPVKVDELPLATDLVFKVTLPNYRGQEYTLQLEAGDDIAVDFGALEHAKGTINPEVTVNGEPINVEQAKKVVFRIGEQTFTGAGKPLQGVYAGPGNIEIIYPDHQIWKQRLRLADLESVTVVADLIPLPGVVAITVDSPVAFRIVVEGKTVKGVDNRYEVRANRDQTVEVRAKDHLTMKRTVRLKPSEELAWNVTMFTIPEPSEGDDWAVPYVGVKLVWIPQGEVRVGSPPSEQGRLPDEGPRTTVRFPTGFWVGRYEVTQEEYRGVIGSNPSEFLGGDRPVERVAWADAMAFCRKVTDLERASNRLPEGYVYRLPTEAEWEYMARAGSEEAFHFGAKADPSKGNFKGVYPRDSADSDGEGKTNESDELYGTAKVGNYTSNAWKIFDVHGNVGEWCYDRFNSRYPGGIVSDWSGPKSGSDRLHRGGGWASFAQRCRLAARERLKPETATSSLGFRMVLGRAIVAE